MSELVKSIILVVVTVVVAVMAVSSIPRNSGTDFSKIRNKELFPAVDVDQVQTVRIVKYDGLATNTFEITKTGRGEWVVPSKSKYPADNSAQVRKLINFLPALRVTNIASDREADKEKYGVIEPREAIENLGQKNVGTLVELVGNGEELLASAVIGAKVAGDEEKSFVVKPGEPHIYVVELDQRVLSTEFKQWINNFLLNLDRSEIKSLRIQRVDSVNSSNDPSDRKVNYEYDLLMQQKLNKWSIGSLTTFDAEQKPEAIDVETVNLQVKRLNEFVTSLDNLLILNAEPKPPGLTSDVLLDAEYIGKTNTQIELKQHGFFVVPDGTSKVQIVSKGGEVTVTKNDGIDLVLRFGDFAKASLDDEGKDNRYLMLSARLNTSVIEKPVLREKSSASGEESPAPSDADDAGSGQRDKEAEDRKRKYLIEMKEYNDQIAKAKLRVQELNDRYAPWFYVISEDSFNELTPAQNELVK